jgi:hypothetical protein
MEVKCYSRRDLLVYKLRKEANLCRGRPTIDHLPKVQLLRSNQAKESRAAENNIYQ